MDFYPTATRQLSDGTTQELDIRPVLGVCPECLTEGLEPDPREGRLELKNTYRVIEAPCSTHQLSRR